MERRAMKTAVILSFMIFASTGYAANAAQFDAFNYSDIEVISVTPRTTTVKPFVMAIYTKEQRLRVAIAASQKNALATKSTNLLR
ncbi:MAG TPA: hypothetical protein VFI23_19615 [Rhizomicrobium sp.]|nr:hypothetical protein [Rhizomicrobium sp.]